MDEKNISSVLEKWNLVAKTRKQLENIEEALKIKIKTFMKERNWDKYFDEDSKINITISIQKRQNMDKEQLKNMLTEAQLLQIMTESSFEKMTIMTPEARERMKKYVKKK